MFAAVFLKVENNPDGGVNCELPFDDAARGGVVGCLLLYLPGDVMDLNQEDGEVNDGDLGELAAAAVAIFLTSVWTASFSEGTDLDDDARDDLEFCFLGVGSNSSFDLDG